MRKPRFRKQPRETGLVAVARPTPNTDILWGGGTVGWIAAPNAFSKDDRWHVWLHVKREPTTEDPADWENRRLNSSHATEAEARDHVRGWWDRLTAKHKLHVITED